MYDTRMVLGRQRASGADTRSAFVRSNLRPARVTTTGSDSLVGSNGALPDSPQAPVTLVSNAESTDASIGTSMLTCDVDGTVPFMDRDLKRTLLRALDEREDTSVSSLAEAIEAHPITTDQRCYELQQKGYIRQTSAGVYVLTDSGEEYLSTLTE